MNVKVKQAIVMLVDLMEDQDQLLPELRAIYDVLVESAFSQETDSPQ